MNKGLIPKDMVVVLGADPEEADRTCRLIEAEPYRTKVCPSLADLRRHASDSWLAVILDVDSLPLDNRTIRTLTLEFPATAFLCVSRERFHPEIKDAICYHLFACINKPIDIDELHYILKCIQNGQTDPGAVDLNE
jgi:hypothetical protein